MYRRWLRGARAGLHHVHVRVGAKAGERIGQCEHLLGDVGMKVQAGDDGHRIAHHTAQAGQQFAFAIIDMFCHGGAVQIEINRVGLLIGRCLHNDAGDAFKRVLRDVRGRRRADPQAGQQRPAECARGRNETAGR
jgi:hypothetical protein